MELTIKKVGGGWLVTIWNPPKGNDLGHMKTEEQVFTTKEELIAFITGKV